MAEQKISKQNHGTRLFTKDSLYLTKKVKEMRFTDKRFENNSAAIRFYTHLGIAQERRTEVANTLDDRIIKASQKEVVTDSLQPLKISIDALTNAMKNFGKEQQVNFDDLNKQTKILSNQVETSNEISTSQLNTILKEVLRSRNIGEESLRNVIVLRSILYVFLLGYKTGRIEPQERIRWEKLILLTHEKAQALSIEELQHLAEGTLETDVVQGLAKELFASIRELQSNHQTE